MAKRFLTMGVMLAGIVVGFLGGAGCQKADQAKEAPAAGIIVKEFSFENGGGEWWPKGTIKYSLTTNIKHSGKTGLVVIGASQVGMWNYIQSSEFKLESGKKYRLSGWMLVKTISEEQFPPLLKCGINQKSKWLANFITPKYDLAKKGEWQELSIEFETPQEPDLTGYFSVETGTKDKSITVDLFLDDLKLEAR